MECRKIRTFLANHSAFFDYLDCGDNSMDSQFFLPRNSDGSNFLLFGRSYDLGVNTASSHDWIISMRMTYKNYHEYINAHSGLSLE
jgi:hypothetical protein